MDSAALQSQSPSLWGFTFQSSESVFIADSSNTANAHFYGWSLGQHLADGGRNWVRSHTVKLSTADPVYSIAGRVENLVDSNQMLMPTFIVYAVSSPESDSSGIWRYNTITRTYALLTSLGTNQVYRSINFPPGFPSASSSNSPAPSVSPSVTVTAFNTASPSGTRSQTGTGSPSSSQTPSGSGTRTVTSSSSQTSSLTASLSPSGTGTGTSTGTPPASLSRTETGTSTHSIGATASVTASASLTASATPSASLSPSGSRSLTASSSGSVSASSTVSISTSQSSTITPSVSSSPSPSPNVNRWASSNLLLLRVGSGDFNTGDCPGYRQSCVTACPCGVVQGTCTCNTTVTCTDSLPNGCATFLDEVNPTTGAMVSSLRLAPSGGQCLLSWGAGFTKEGFGSTSTDGRYVTVPCYDSAANRSVARRTLLRIYADGSSDATFLPVSMGSLIAVTTPDGTSTYVSSMSSESCSAGNGYKYLQWGDSGSLTQLTPGFGECSYDARVSIIGASDGSLQGAFGMPDFAGIYTVGGLGYPPTGATTARMLPGFADDQVRAPSPWGFVYHPANSSALWVADDRAPSVAHVYSYVLTYVAPSGVWKWINAGFHRFATSDPVYSIAGRLEGSTFFIYAVSAPERDFSQLWRLNTNTRTSVLLGSLQTKQAYRAVMFPPVWASASATSSRAPTVTLASTPSRSQTATRSWPASATRTATGTGSGKSSQTGSQTSSSTPRDVFSSPSNSCSGTPVPSPSPMGNFTEGTSTTARGSASTAASNAPSVSTSLTGSPSSSTGSSGTMTHTASVSQQALSSQTPSAAASLTQTAVPSSPASSAPASLSATSSGAPTPSSTSTLSTSLTPTLTRSRTSTPSPPVCRPPVNIVTVLTGSSGSSSPVSSTMKGNNGMYTSGSCSAGLKTFVNGPRLVYMLRLGEDTALGGTFIVTTCGFTKNNTLLYIGTGCPTWQLPFGCLAGNDNAGDLDGLRTTACASNARASTVSIVATSRTYFVQVGSASGEDFVSGLAWQYSPLGSPSASRTGTVTGSKSRTASQTRSRTATRSRTRKPK